MSTAESRSQLDLKSPGKAVPHSLSLASKVEICVLKRLGITYLRIDGQTDVNARNERVQKFQTESQHYSCMLLTTRVGGYGLNLTSADRVIILDPAWNPAVDMQAVDRAHRIGQDREVKTYRLIMSGLIEEQNFGEAMDG